MGIFDSLTDLTKDVFEVVSAPIEVVVDIADASIKPIADAAKEIKDEVKTLKD